VDRQAEGLGGLEVNQQLEVRWLLNGQIRRLGALQDLVHIGGRASMEIIGYGMGHQAIDVGHEGRIRVGRRQSMAGRKLAHSCALNKEDAFGRREESFCAFPAPSVERRRKVLRGLDVVELAA